VTQLNAKGRIARLVLLGLIFTTSVFAANQNSVRSWIVGMAIPPGTLNRQPLYLRATDLWDSLAGYAAVDVISADRATRLDRILIKDDYGIGTTPIATGTEIYLHVYSTASQYEYYDAWYHTTVGQGNRVMRLRPGLGTKDAPAPIGGIDEEDFGRIARFTTGGSWYWQITPALFIQWRDDRVNRANVKFNLQSPNGTSIRRATGLTAAPGTPDSAAADFIATSPQFTLKLTVDLTDPGRVYGQPMLFLGPPPNYDWRIGYLVIWITFNNTYVRPGYLAANGWSLLNVTTTPGYMNFYRVLPPITGTLGSVGHANLDIPVDTGDLHSGTGISVRIWIADLQVPADAAQGVSNAVPTTYGGVTQYGLASTIFENGFMTSTNAPTAQLIWAAFKAY
jgi:hypothetical protein